MRIMMLQAIASLITHRCRISELGRPLGGEGRNISSAKGCKSVCRTLFVCVFVLSAD